MRNSISSQKVSKTHTLLLQLWQEWQTPDSEEGLEPDPSQQTAFRVAVLCSISCSTAEWQLGDKGKEMDVLKPALLGGEENGMVTFSRGIIIIIMLHLCM